MNEYKCTYCNKSYKLKQKYENHLTYCEFLYLSTRDRNELLDTVDDKEPTLKELYKMFQHMAVRIDKLEKENLKLRQVQKSKMNIVEWLNQSSTIPKKSLVQWIKDSVIPIVCNHLESVFNENLQAGIIKVLEEAISKEEIEEIPIRYFENKNSFYMLKIDKTTEKLSWCQLSNINFDKYMSAIAKQFMIDFNNFWYCENKEKIDKDDKYKDLYVNYYKNILGGDGRSDETMYKNIRDYMSKQVKQNVKTIREYEIE